MDKTSIIQCPVQVVSIIALVFSTQYVQAASPSQRHTTTTPTPPAAKPNKLLVMMYSGLRWDSINDQMPGIRRMMDEGVHAHHMQPVFPTSSLPNHLSIVTGLYPETHGILGNDMYDKDTGEIFTFRTATDANERWWKHVEPVWAAAAKQGKRVRVDSWPGCEIAMKDGFHLNSTQCIKFNPHLSTDDLQEKVDKALTDLADDKLDFVAVYYEDPDKTQQHQGFNSSKARDVIAKLDVVVQHLQDKADTLTVYDGKTKLSDKLNVMLVSDHGHMNLIEQGKVDLQKLLATHMSKKVLTSGAQLSIWPEDNGKQIYEELQKVEHLTAYWREDLPDRWHYKHGKFAAPIMCNLDPGYYYLTPDQKSVPIRSSYGWDNNVTNMQAIFLARGPNIQQRGHIDPVENIDLYQIMTSMLGIKASPNNGTWSKVTPFVQHLIEHPAVTLPDEEPVSFKSVVVTVTVAVICVIVLTMIVCGIHHYRQRTRTKQYKTLPTNIDNDFDNDELDL